MEFEPWYLSALPVLFGVGWWARGYEARVRAADQGAAPRSLFRGLQLLLSDEPDRAIDAFIEVVKLDPETIELHYALGSLFRRRGEIDRAVRIHNYLLSRADLPAAERANALAELGRDYLKGGMLDRAENAFSRLLEERMHRFEALRSLLRIYQMEREWKRAIECAQRLEGEAGETHKTAIAHFHCELAEQAIVAGDFDQAGVQLEAALAAHRKSVRAAILAGDVAVRRGRRAEAIGHWLRIAAEAPEYMPLVMDRLISALDAEGRRAQAAALLRRSLQENPSIDSLDLGCRWIREWEGDAAAETLLREELKRNPSLLGFERLLALRGDPVAADPELALLRGLIQTHAQKLARYRCNRCGFRSREFYWNCPGCSSWDSYPPRRLEELEVA
ncbi:MAG TPA: lipopolysaccharide assembly protein LapB [Burkholderiaceae bacterium]|jgi:lipopolysaccharide biosynthesis regulator YciM|nr:lipopolysaccharide assembly protein LapB [Burkholderiaceae bacterium]